MESGAVVPAVVVVGEYSIMELRIRVAIPRELFYFLGVLVSLLSYSFAIDKDTCMCIEFLKVKPISTDASQF